jgi:hypothetical protein
MFINNRNEGWDFEQLPETPERTRTRGEKHVERRRKCYKKKSILVYNK